MSAQNKQRAEPMGAVWGWVANLVAIAPLVVAHALHGSNREAYYMAVQEDELLEWATVWAFLVAAVVFVSAAVRQRRATGKLPWFLAGVALFCVFVAGEEISWGQRVLGYRPPDYFLAENFQQELNVHNVVDTSLRKLGLKGVIVGYGILLPLLARAAPLRRLLAGAAVIPPPLALLPAFLVALVAYERYDLKFTGEVVELMLGFGFLFAALAGAAPGAAARAKPLARLALATGLVLALGFVAAAFSRGQRGADPAVLQTAQTEAATLKRDFHVMASQNRGRAVTKCGLHKRLYSFVEKYDKDYLRRGTFAALTGQGLPEQRAEFFLDPWNSPYWVRDECDRGAGRRIIFVYSFGPNRARDSTEWKIGGDDIGAVIFELRP